MYITIFVLTLKPTLRTHQVYNLRSLAFRDDDWLSHVGCPVGIRLEEPQAFLGIICGVESPFEKRYR